MYGHRHNCFHDFLDLRTGPQRLEMLLLLLLLLLLLGFLLLSDFQLPKTFRYSTGRN